MKKIILIALSLPLLSACSPSMFKMSELPIPTNTNESQPSETLELPNFADLLPEMPEFPNFSDLLPEMPELLTLTDTNKTKELEEKRIAKAKAIADKKAAEVAKEKAIVEAKALEEKCIAKAKAIADKKAAEVAKEKRKIRAANLKEGYEAYKKAIAYSKAAEETRLFFDTLKKKRIIELKKGYEAYKKTQERARPLRTP